jgi:hypothetical protein
VEATGAAVAGSGGGVAMTARPRVRPTAVVIAAIEVMVRVVVFMVFSPVG